MTRGLTYEYVKSKFEEEGWTLLSMEYVNNGTKMLCKCEKGHVQYKTLKGINQKQTCAFCFGNSKLDYDYVKNYFAGVGYKLLSKYYVNSGSKLEYECDKKHTHSVSWDDFKSGGRRCPYCNGGIRKNYEEVKASFERIDYKLLSTEYVNNHTKLDYECNKGHCHKVSWNDFRQGSRCPYCYGNIPDTYENVKQYFNSFGYTLLSDTYLNCDSKLQTTCPRKHSYSVTWYHFKNGVRCAKCYFLDNSGKNNSNWQGGISFERYCSAWKDKEYKEYIKYRDNNVCQNPYCYKTDNVLHIHHIDYDKKNCPPSNLITVCRSCNARANFYREWHTEWYRTIMSKKFKYKY